MTKRVSGPVVSGVSLFTRSGWAVVDDQSKKSMIKLINDALPGIFASYSEEE